MPEPERTLPDVGVILAYHARACRCFFKTGTTSPAEEDGALWTALVANHENNMFLWAEEDLARRRMAADSEIANNKRAIDRFNQARNDAVERMDDALVGLLFNGGRGRLNSETPGSIIDRLSIASLKHYHMALQARREDVDDAHRENCRTRLRRIGEQRDDLARCLHELLRDCLAGQAVFKTYRQFKMYNDPALNMALVREAAASLSTGCS